MPRDMFNEFGEVRDLLYWPKYFRGTAREIIRNIEAGGVYLVRIGDKTEDVTRHMEAEARHAVEQIDLMIQDQKDGHF